MSVSDPVADYLTCVRNASAAKKKRVDVPSSNMKRSITELLKKEHFIRDYQVIEDEKQNVLRLHLRYDEEGKACISGIKRVSKPGRRQYVGQKEVPRVLGGLGVAILSTPVGLVTDKEARKLGVGGEVICTVW